MITGCVLGEAVAAPRRGGGRWAAAPAGRSSGARSSCLSFLAGAERYRDFSRNRLGLGL